MGALSALSHVHAFNQIARRLREWVSAMGLTVAVSAAAAPHPSVLHHFDQLVVVAG